MRLTAYTVSAKQDIIQPASAKRTWMDTAAAKNPYRCLPLSMANSWGWEILSSAKFTATWDGKMGADAVKIQVHEGTNAPTSHFGEGTLTWHTGYLFNTDYPVGLYVMGPTNSPKPNVIPLSGIVETHWLSYSFTMNWRFTQPGSFTVDIGEPYCQIFPVYMNMFDDVQPEIRTLSENEQLYDLYWDWNISRQNYSRERKIPGSAVSSPSTWQKHYFQGKYPAGKIHPTGSKCPFHKTDSDVEVSNHITKPPINNFIDLQTEPFKTTTDYVARTKESDEKYNTYLKTVRETEILKAPSMGTISKTGTIINRTDEEINERIEYYKQLLKQQILDVKNRRDV
jgi:hypothetical protein